MLNGSNTVGHIKIIFLKSMQIKYNSNYPSIEDLRNKAQKKIPRFAFGYLDGGCNEEVNLPGEITQFQF